MLEGSWGVETGSVSLGVGRGASGPHRKNAATKGLRLGRIPWTCNLERLQGRSIEIRSKGMAGDQIGHGWQLTSAEKICRTTETFV